MTLDATRRLPAIHTNEQAVGAAGFGESGPLRCLTPVPGCRPPRGAGIRPEPSSFTCPLACSSAVPLYAALPPCFSRVHRISATYDGTRGGATHGVGRMG